ncbi:MAG TPA: NmrA family NAD(P)-binding protein [Polyangiaceae bacterium]|nr:NmrA family NAD(P)-binding protein [Polyangiaceae bacterium]
MDKQSDGPVLVVGATGNLGSLIVKELREVHRDVRAAVRPTSSIQRRSSLERLGAVLVDADLKNVASLEVACRGVAVVVSTATAIVSRQPGDTLEAVDQNGQLALVDACARSGVRHFVFVSVSPGGPDIAFVRAKRGVEHRLASTAMSFTCLQPAPFMEAWLSPALGFDPANGVARIFGTGQRPVSWVSAMDVARFALGAVLNRTRFHNVILPLGGPEALSQMDAIRIFRESGAPEVRYEQVLQAALESQLREAPGPFEQAMSALCLGIAHGMEVDCQQALTLLPGRMRSVRDHARDIMRGRT